MHFLLKGAEDQQLMQCMSSVKSTAMADHLMMVGGRHVVTNAKNGFT